ncbi:SH3 domain-containing protein [Streptomyces capillispiralis]|uniref:SH3 domain-containing protein n=1 Tax=Streptomyces capillispiralis TaxID=68182 RepID=UPI00368170DE
MKKRILAAALVISGLTLTAGPVAQAAQAAQAMQSAQSTRGLSAPHAAGQQAFVCTVNDDRVNFRGGPGTQYPVLGQVNRGQQFTYRNQEGEWVMGDLVGGRTGVWIHYAYLDC